MSHDVRQGRAGTAGAVSAMIILLSAAAGCTVGNGTAPPTPNNLPPSSSPTASQELPPVTVVPKLLDTSALELPLDDYLLTPDEVDQASRARRELIRRCMQRFGTPIVIPEPPSTSGPKTTNERRYGLTNLAAAEKLGYAFSEPSTRPRGNRAEPTLTDEARAVFTGQGDDLPPGLPEGGCGAEAQRRLTPRDPNTKKPLDPDLPQRLSLESFQRSENDPRVQAAFVDWSRCMQKGGHQYKGPFDPPADPRFRPPGTPTERKTAQDDVACKASTNLVGRWYAVESAYQASLIADHKTQLTALEQAQPAIKKLAQTLTRGR